MNEYHVIYHEKTVGNAPFIPALVWEADAVTLSTMLQRDGKQLRASRYTCQINALIQNPTRKRHMRPRQGDNGFVNCDNNPSSWKSKHTNGIGKACIVKVPESLDTTMKQIHYE